MKRSALGLGFLVFASSTHAHTPAPQSQLCSESLTQLSETTLKSRPPPKLPFGSVNLSNIKLRPPEGRDFIALRDTNGSLTYVVTADNQLYVVDAALPKDLPTGWLVNTPEGGLPVKNAGYLVYRDESFVQDQRYGFGLSSDEMTAVENGLRRNADFHEPLRRQGVGRFAEPRVLECSQMLRQPVSAKNFLLLKLGADMTMLTGGIMLYSPERFDVLEAEIGLSERDPQRDYDEDKLLADYVGGTTSSLIKGINGYQLASTGTKLSQSLLRRSVVNATSVGVQHLMYAGLTNNDANGISTYNGNYAVFAMVKSHYLDKWIFSRLPDWIMDSCLIHPRMRLLVNQGVFRFGEGLFSTVLYFWGRDALLDE